MFEFHSCVATLPASKAYNAPGVVWVKALPLVETVAHRMPLPGVSPFAESARMPPGSIWLATFPRALGGVTNVLRLKEEALSWSFEPQLNSKGPPLAAERCQYTGPPRLCPGDMFIFWTAPL